MAFGLKCRRGKKEKRDGGCIVKFNFAGYIGGEGILNSKKTFIMDPSEPLPICPVIYFLAHIFLL